MTADYVTDLKARIVALLRETFTDWDAIPYRDVRRDGGRYFTVSTLSGDFRYDRSEQWFDKDVQFAIRAVAGYVTEGYDGQIEQVLDTIIPQVEQLFLNAAETWLTCTAYPTVPVYTSETAPRLLSFAGPEVLDQSAEGGRTISALWVLSVAVQLETGETVI